MSSSSFYPACFLSSRLFSAFIFFYSFFYFLLHLHIANLLFHALNDSCSVFPTQLVVKKDYDVVKKDYVVVKKDVADFLDENNHTRLVGSLQCWQKTITFGENLRLILKICHSSDYHIVTSDRGINSALMELSKPNWYWHFIMPSWKLSTIERNYSTKERETLNQFSK